MLIMKLDGAYLPVETIELKDDDSFVWTERHQTSGDFQIVVFDDLAIINTLLIGDCISHTDTKEVMIVENHEIKRDNNKRLQVTISGRSFETFAENRITIGSEMPIQDDADDEPYEEIIASTNASNLAATLLRYRLETGTASSNDAVPNLVIETDMRLLDTAADYNVQRGSVYDRVMEALKVADAGIKTIRPPAAGTNLRLVIHDGLDLTASLSFNALDEDLDEATYFWSIKGYKNYVAVATKYFERLYRHRDILVNLTGLDRRVMYEEARDIAEDYTAGTSSSDQVAARAQIILDQHRRVALMQATISITARPKFKVDYDVGDIVMVLGEFGAVQAMQVTEHILTVDAEGMRGYPSLTIY